MGIECCNIGIRLDDPVRNEPPRLDRVGRDEEMGCPGRTKKLTMK